MREEKVTGTSLICIENPGRTRPSETRALATLVTQLIAKAQDMPHLRDKRREAPNVVIATYRKMLNLNGVPKRNIRPL